MNKGDGMISVVGARRAAERIPGATSLPGISQRRQQWYLSTTTFVCLFLLPVVLFFFLFFFSGAGKSGDKVLITWIFGPRRHSHPSPKQLRIQPRSCFGVASLAAAFGFRWRPCCFVICVTLFSMHKKQLDDCT